jgi:hypothetical protein
MPPLLAPAVSRIRVDAEVLLVSSSGWAHGMSCSGCKVIYCTLRLGGFTSRASTSEPGSGWRRAAGGLRSWTCGSAPKDSVEARRMKLDSSRALERLGWQPVWSADRSVDATVEWYVAYGERRDMRATTLGQIRSFESSSSATPKVDRAPWAAARRVYRPMATIELPVIRRRGGSAGSSGAETHSIQPESEGQQGPEDRARVSRSSFVIGQHRGSPLSVEPPLLVGGPGGELLLHQWSERAS